MNVGDLIRYKKEFADTDASPGVVIEVPIGRSYVTVAFNDNIATCHQSIVEIINASR